MKIAIVGAGLIGRLLALSILRDEEIKSSNKISISLFEKDDKHAHNSAAYAAAGLLTPIGESVHCEPNIVDMGFKALALWPKFLDSLQEYTIFQQTGAIMVSHEQDKGDYQRFVRHVQSNYPEQPLHKLDRKGLTELEPEIGRSFNQGLYLPQEGQLGNRRLLVALRQQLEQETEESVNGNTFNWLTGCEVVDIDVQPKQSTVTYIHTYTDVERAVRQSDELSDKKSQQFDLVIDCRGAGATTNRSRKGCAPLQDLRAVRGEIFQLFAPDVNISRPVRLMHPRYQLYIAPKGKGYYVVGATEIESDDDSPMTVRSAMELLSAAYSVHPGFAEANIRQHVSQCRPAFSDNQPKITQHDSLIQVNGLFRHGFLIAPVVAEQTLAMIGNYVNNTDKSLPYEELLSVSITNSKSKTNTINNAQLSEQLCEET